ncbi:hypothetical protein KR093_006409 [Drosophila rubida]|uniref:THO complex subunit 6 n=1 Tax=Drosophila rubida TaxID=30044 RepID=A0AAD4PLG9_9MUSC|nr:hypothetical protein KR093_006409 [Drosophila rubida]
MKERELKRAYNNVVAQTISTSQKFLFAGNQFGDIFILSLKELEKGNEEPPSKLEMHPQDSDVHINCLAFHRDFLIVGTIGLIYGLKWDEDEEMLSKNRAWEIKIPMQIDAVQVPDVNCLWLCSETDALFAGCGDNIIHKINLEDGRIEREFRGHTDYIHCVVGQSEGRIYSGAEDGTVRAWCDKQKQETSVMEPYKNPQLLRPDWGKWIGGMAVNDDWLICGGGPRPAIFHLGAMQYTRAFDFPGRVHVCDFVDDAVFIGGEHNHVQFYTLNGTLQANIPVEHTATYSSVWQMDPFKFMSIAGFSNKLHILKDFRFLDSKLELYVDDSDADNEELYDEDASF